MSFTSQSSQTAAGRMVHVPHSWHIIHDGRIDWLHALLLTAALANAVAFLVALPVVLQRVDPTRDLSVYFRLLRRLHAGGEIYYPHPQPGPHTVRMIYLYPPFFAALFKLLPPVGFAAFARTWTALLVVGFWAYACTLAFLARGRLLWQDALVAGLALSLCPGALNAIGIGQADPLLWPLIGLGLASRRARAPALTAVTLVKPMPLVALACVVLRERWRAVIGTVATVLAATALACIAFGAAGFVSACLDWFRFVSPALGQGSWASFNFSLSFAPLRLARLVGWVREGTVLPFGARLWLTAASLGGPMLLAWALRKKRPELQYSVAIAAAVVLSPICWNSYLAFLLAPVAVMLRAWLSRPEASLASATGPAAMPPGLPAAPLEQL